jgi:folate-dependent phosphoribosylglycinamide formyltransferase PurN
MKWIALFSQTGSEINRIAQALGRWPDAILTNNRDLNDWEDYIDLTETSVFISNTNGIHNALRVAQPAFVTLHGYLRIIPADICDRHEMYNGHPALITEYPELKGKDPQERVWIAGKEIYPNIGSVVHKCTPELDGGKVMSVAMDFNDCNTKLELYNKLKDTSLKAWVNFLEFKL